MSILSRRLLPLSLTHPACLARASPRRAHSAMVAGPARTAMEEVAKGGEFVRSESVHRNWVKQGGPYEPESGRYHLYIAYACPWACRAYATIKLKGLEDHIGLSVVHPVMQRTRPGVDNHVGWAFRKPGDPPVSSAWGVGSFPCDELLRPDTVNNAGTIRDLYEMVGDQGGKYSVPVFWDKKTKAIVNNESSELIRMLNAEFDHLARNPSLDLYPEDLRAAIDEVNAWVYPGINNGVYRCGFARSQEAYDVAVTELFQALDRAESILSRQRWMAGDGTRFTEADLRLFMTLVRFDAVYVQHFKCTKRDLREYPHLHAFTREVYKLPGMKDVIRMDHIRGHYFTSHEFINSFAIIPICPDLGLDVPHGRDAFPDKTPGLYNKA